jgi:lysylphosphatidylglycerol synthetase-like protein (DUF2156 family)
MSTGPHEPTDWDGGRDADLGAPPPGPTSTAPQPPSNAPAIAALVCGIVGVVLSWIPFINFLAVILAIVAIITGVVGLRRAGPPEAPGKGMAIAGLITGAVALVVSVVVLWGIATLFTDPAFQEELDRELQRQRELQEQLED